jgi:cation-transporting ATPase V/Cu+-exporting ATPase
MTTIERRDAAPTGSGDATQEFAVEGMSCASCATRVQRVLADMPGVRSASVNLATRRATIAHADEVSVAALQRVIKDAGYELVTLQPAGVEAPVPEALESAAWLRRLVVAAPLAVIVFILSAGWMDETWARIASAALTVPVQFWAGMPFLRSGFVRARHLSSNMDTLIAIGTLAAFSFSTWNCSRAAISTLTAPR